MILLTNYIKMCYNSNSSKIKPQEHKMNCSEFADIIGVRIIREETDFWLIAPIIRYLILSEKTIKIICRFRDRKIQFEKELPLSPKDAHKAYLLKSAAISRICFEGEGIEADMELFVNSKLNSRFTFQFTPMASKLDIRR